VPLFPPLDRCVAPALPLGDLGERDGLLGAIFILNVGTCFFISFKSLITESANSCAGKTGYVALEKREPGLRVGTISGYFRFISFERMLVTLSIASLISLIISKRDIIYKDEKKCKKDYLLL